MDLQSTINSGSGSGSESHMYHPQSQFPDSSQNVRPAGNQRNRPQLSCISCRQSKLKCDRKTPCSQCIKKGKSSQCAFPAPLPRRKKAVSMQSRLKQLESLVKDAMTAQNPIMQNTAAYQLDDTHNAPGSTRRPSSNSGQGFKEPEVQELPSGNVLQGTNEATYLGGSNWAAIFENIEEMQNYFDEHDDVDHADTITPFTTLNFNTSSSKTKFQLLTMLPDRPVVDRLVSLHFNSNSPGLQIIHRPTFQNQYQTFWANTATTPVAWLGLLFSILVLASIASLGSLDEDSEQFVETMKSIRTYRESCVQSLLLSNYTRPGPHTIETLAIYMEADFLLSKDDQVHLFLLVGNTVRLAMRMGLHRDSSKIGGNIIPFQAEMRRRIWHHLVQIDILSSFQIGLPGMTQSVESDTKYPSNLRDEDFSEDSFELPTARPDSELTPMTYTINKSHISHFAGKIAAIANRLKLPSYDEVMTLDEQLNIAHSKVPQFFQLTPHTFITDAPERIIKRFSIALLYQKSRCLLHRSFMMKGRHHSEYAYSRKAGLEASIELLKCQTLVYDAASPGGSLSRDRWFLSSLSMHDFLLAAMVVYMSIMQSVEDGVTIEDPNIKEMVICLAKSHSTWKKHWINAFEAKKAASILAGMLNKIRLASEKSTGDMAPNKSTGGNGHGSIPPNLIANLNLGDYLLAPDPFQPSTNDANWASSDSTSPSSGIAAPFNVDSEANMLPLEELIDFSGDFDWELFDNELRPPQPTNQAWPGLNDDILADADAYYY